MMKFILTTIVFLALAISGVAQTRNVIVNTNGVIQSPTNFWSADASNARSGLGQGLSALTNTSVTNFRTAIGLGVTNDVTFGGLTASFVNFENVEIGPDLKLEEDGDVLWGTLGRFNVDTMEFSKAISFNNTTNAATTRTNLGGTTVGNAVFTATNAAAAADAIGLGATNQVGFDSVQANDFTVSDGGTISFEDTGSIEFGNAAGPTRTNLGLGWSALTNTSTAGFNTSLYGSGTNPVLYNTNGEVVSPTNFWQVAPITTTFIESQPTTNQTTNMPAGRNLHIHSIAPSTVGITNTIALPTTNSFNGDVALVVHQGPTSSVTAVRTAGASTNLITLNQFEEAVEFVYYNSVWQFNHNLSYIEPIFFSGTNAAANAAASRTNLGLGSTNLVQFLQVDAQTIFVDEGGNGIQFNGEPVAAATRTNLGLGATNNVSFDGVVVGSDLKISNGALYWDTNVVFEVETATFGTQVYFTEAAATRTNLGLGLPALTNTNNVNFQAAIFNTNSAPTNSANVNAVNFYTAIHWMEVNVATNGVTNNFRIPLFK